MSNPVGEAVRNQAENILSSLYKGVVGGIFNSKGSSSTSAFKDLEAPTESKHLSYPANVDTDLMQGHWIMFEILQLNESKIKRIEAAQAAAVEYYLGEGADVAQRVHKHKSLLNKDVPDVPKMGSDANASTGRGMLIAEAEASVKLEKSIALYMPPSISVSYNANYADKEISTVADLAGDAIQAFTLDTEKDTFQGIGNALSQMNLGHLIDGVRSGLIRAADAIVPGVETLWGIHSGRIIGNHMELMFQGVGRRSFSFTFVFIPKSASEAATVEKICKLFKFHMMPEWANATTKRSMTIPDMFDITYMYQKGPTPYLNKISTCFCKSAQVTYGSNRYTAYTDGRPQRITLALTFSEINIITRDRIEEGF